MAFLILDIETLPRPSIDAAVEETISKKVKSHIERTGDDPQNVDSLIRSTHLSSAKCFVLVCAGSRMRGVLKTKLYVVKMKAQLY